MDVVRVSPKHIFVILLISVIICVTKTDANGKGEDKKPVTTSINLRPNWTTVSVTTTNSSLYEHARKVHSNFGLPAPDEIHHQRLNYNKVISHDWLLRNITALWKFMRHIKRDVKQLKKQMNWRKSSNTSSKSNTLKNRKKESDVEVKCDMSWFQPHPNICKSSENATTCNGNGNCICGQCRCKSPHYGEFCQCNDLSCQSFEGELCGGVRQGQCRCGECVCRPNFSGPSCSCSIETNRCTKDGIMCSSRGSCDCNNCQCTDGFTGSLCQEDIYSASVCENMKPCVLCQAYGIQHHKCNNCSLKIKSMTEVTGDGKKTCIYFYRGCFLKYSYADLQSKDEPMTVYTSEKLNCD